MIRKTDWQAAYRDLIAEGRQRMGEPPTAEEIEAYLRGDLAAEDAKRVRELLIYYPELADAMEAPFPFPHEGKPGDADFLSAEEMARDWAAIQTRISSLRIDAASGRRRAGEISAPGRPRRFWSWERDLRPWQLSGLAAALLAVFLGGLLLRSQQELRRLQHESREPRTNLEHRLLLPDGQRGGTAEQPPIPLSSQADYFLFIPSLIDPSEYPDYQLELQDLSATPPRPIWSGKGLRRRSDDTFEVLVPRAFLKPGKYEFVLSGLRGAEKRVLARYTVRLSPPSGWRETLSPGTGLRRSFDGAPVDFAVGIEQAVQDGEVGGFRRDLLVDEPEKKFQGFLLIACSRAARHRPQPFQSSLGVGKGVVAEIKAGGTLVRHDLPHQLVLVVAQVREDDTSAVGCHHCLQALEVLLQGRSFQSKLRDLFAEILRQRGRIVQLAFVVEDRPRKIDPCGNE